MGLFGKKKSQSPTRVGDSTWQGNTQKQQDPRLPGIAGFHGKNKGKNAMPEYRFNYVAPSQKRDQ